jgi:iron complex outermembrane recepter protein
MKSIIKVAALAMTALSPVSAYAQSAPASDEALDESTIVVTARKTEERLQDAPIAVSVATAETIERLGLDSVTDIAKTTPGLVFDDSFGRDGNRPVIRGQGNILGFSGVAYFIDGIYYSGSIADYDVDSLQRIEVVKGPQSALYGRNTYSGAINLISKAPSSTWQGRVQADVSERSRYEISANIRGPIAEGFGISLGGRYYSNKGEFTNTYDGSRLGKQQTFSANGMLTYDTGSDFRFSLRMNYNQTDDGQPAIFAQSANANNCFPDNGAVYRGQGRYFCGTIVPQALATDYSRQFIDPERVGLEARTFNGGFRADFDISDQLTFTSLTGYNSRTADTKTDGDYSPSAFQLVIFAYGATGPAPVPVGARTTRFSAFATSVQDFTFSNRQETDDFSQEFRLAYKSDRVKLLLGGYYFDQTDNTADTRIVPGGALALAQANSAAATTALCAALPTCGIFTPVAVTAANLPNSRNTNAFKITNKAIFGSATFNVTEALSIIAEGRFAGETIRQATQTFNEGTSAPAPRIVEATFNKFTPRITLSWKASPNHSLYGVFAKGQKPGGFNANAAIIAGFPTFDPENSKTFEIGSKNQFFDRKLTLNLALYHTEVSGYQITQSVSVPPNQVALIRNGGTARINGAEVELIARPARNFTLTASYALADAKFTFGDDENLGLILDVKDNGLVDCSTGDQFPLIAGCQSLYGSIVGKRVPRAPRHTLFVDADYRTPIGSGDWKLFAGANLSVISSSFDQVLNFADTGGSKVVDARLGVQNDRFKLQLYVKNLFNEDSVAQIIRYADAAADLRRNFIAGRRPARRFGAVFSANF